MRNILGVVLAALGFGLLGAASGEWQIASAAAGVPLSAGAVVLLIDWKC